MTAPDTRLHAFAIAAPGLEPWVERELRDLGVAARTTPGGAAFDGTLRDVWRVNLWSRLASRVVVRVGEFRVRALGELARRAGTLPWAEWLAPGSRLHLRVSARKSRLYHTGAIAERVVEGVAGRVPVVPAAQGPADEEGDDESGSAAMLVVRLAHDQCTISLDSSGALLHRRGYRLASAKAPLRETLAAAMLYAGGWKPDEAVLDPLCGAGTIPIEAAMRARDIAPGLARSFAFERFPMHDGNAWSELRADARARIRPRAPALILGSDRDAGAIAAAIGNAGRAGVAEDVRFTHAALSHAPRGGPGSWIVTNPPYGVRVGDVAKLRDLYAALGRLARESRCGLLMLSADPALERQLGVRVEHVLATRNGGLAVRLVRAVPDAVR